MLHIISVYSVPNIVEISQTYVNTSVKYKRDCFLTYTLVWLSKLMTTTFVQYLVEVTKFQHFFLWEEMTLQTKYLMFFQSLPVSCSTCELLRQVSHCFFPGTVPCSIAARKKDKTASFSAVDHGFRFAAMQQNDNDILCTFLTEINAHTNNLYACNHENARTLHLNPHQ